MAPRTHYSKPYLSMIETGKRPATADVAKAYEKVLSIGQLGDNVNRRDFFKVASVVGSHTRGRLASVQCGKPVLAFLGGQGSGLSPRRALNSGCLAHWNDRHRAVPSCQAHQARDHNLRCPRSADGFDLDCCQYRSTAGVSTSRTRGAPSTGLTCR